jgi:predicted transcriptional regulator
MPHSNEFRQWSNRMVSITVQIDEDVARSLDQIAQSQNRPREEVVREALANLAPAATGVAAIKGLGAYHSGRSDVSEQCGEILNQAVAEGQWP